MNRKILMPLLFVLCLVLFAMPALAAGTGSVTVSEATTPVGETVEVVYSLEGIDKADTLSVQFTVPKGLRLESAEWLIDGAIADVDMQKHIAVWTAKAPVVLAEKTPVFSMTFTVLDDADAAYEVSVAANAKLSGEEAGKTTGKGSVVPGPAVCKHDFVETPAKAPTCTATGNNRYYTCKLCSKVFTADKNVETTVAAQTLPVTAHKLSWVVDKWPSEASEGAKHQACSACGYTCSTGTVIPKLVHTPELVAGKAATCQETGILEHFHCKNCGKYYASENGKAGAAITKEETVLPLADHEYATKWESDAKSHWHECKCGKEADKESHKAKIMNAEAATETKDGYTGDTVCEICGYEVAKGQKIPATGIQTPTTQPSVPATAPTEPVETPDEGSNLPLIICIIAAVAAGCAAAALIIMKKRK